MLPNVIVRDVSRADVDRIADWLMDEAVSSRWFGHYAFGDPVHRGYEPSHMLEASDSEWSRVFRIDPHRVILSICNERGGHIGEVQLLSDGSGGAELSLLIGRKDLWHRGYGSATVIKLLGMAFDEYRFNRVWVHVPLGQRAGPWSLWEAGVRPGEHAGPVRPSRRLGAEGPPAGDKLRGIRARAVPKEA